MIYDQFAWLIHCNNEPSTQQGLRDASVNWVMPWAGDGVAWPGEPVAGAGSGAQVWAQAGNLLRPWRHTVTGWFGVDANGTILPLTTADTSTARDELGLWASLEDELIDTTRDCGEPFSSAPPTADMQAGADPSRRTLGTRNTLPHALAPLTHLPAALAQDVLGVTRYFRYEEMGSTFVAYAPACTIELDGTIVTFTPKSATVTGALVKIDCEATAPDGTRLIARDFQLITRSAGVPVATTPAQLALGGADVADTHSRANMMAAALDPFTLLADSLDDIGRAVATTPAPDLGTASTAERLLADLLGTGLVRSESVKRAGLPPAPRQVGIWERLREASAADGAAMYAAFAGAGSRVALLADLADCRTESGTALPELWSVLSPLLDACQQPAQPTAPWPKPAYGDARGRAMLTATSRLLGADGVRHLRTLWFVAMVRRYAADHPGHPVFNYDKAGKGLAYWHGRLYPLVDAQLCAQLEAVLAPDKIGSGWLANAGTIDAASAARLARRLALRTLLWAGHRPRPPAGGAAILAVLRQRAMRRVDGLRVALTGHDHADDAPVSQGEDRDLAITVTFAATDPNVALNQEIRGYAVAIAAGASAPASVLHWQWITDVAAQVRQANHWEPLTRPGPGGERRLRRMHDTIGATRIDGRDVVAFPYAGTGLNGRLTTVDGGADPDGLSCIDFFWPDATVDGQAWATPRLAYGLHYWVRATPLGNAGRVLDDSCADSTDVSRRTLCRPDAKMFVDHGVATRYLCRVAPGLPLLAIQSAAAATKAYELADESRTRAFLRARPAGVGDPAVPRIALIHDNDPQWRGGGEHVTFTLSGPAATPNVIDRWLQADRAALHGEGVPDDASEGLDDAALAQLQAQYRKLLKPAADADVAARPVLPDMPTLPQLSAHRARWPRHPAVRAFLVEVAFYDDRGRPRDYAQALLQPQTSAAAGYIPDAIIHVEWNAGSGLTAGPHHGATVRLGRGQFCCISVSALAPAELFEPAAAAARMAAFRGLGDFHDRTTHLAWRRFAPATHWVECLAAPVEAAALAFPFAQRLAVVPAQRKVIAQFQADTALPLDATWLKACLLQRHEWHWTGYPVAFPHTAAGQAALVQWAEPFIGTESLRETTTATLDARLSEHGWTCAETLPEKLASCALPGEHGAKYIVYTVRLIRRFDRWLKRWPTFDNQLLAAALLVPARVRWDDPALRLPPPVVRATVPLVKSFEVPAQATSEQIRVGTNGCLLCLDDVLYRTDTLARFGGVGETLELDLEETRFNEIYEIGPNPALHPAPGTPPLPALNGLAAKPRLPYPSRYAQSGAPAADRPYRALDWRVEADRPFGLSYDDDRNARVAQTAVIVRPRGNDVSQYWIMAKVRVRRLLDPGAAWTAPAPVARSEAHRYSWRLGRRPEGDDWVPHDFCLDAGADGFVALLGLGEGEWPIPAEEMKGAASLAPPPAQAPTRYLCTWHKGYWARNDQHVWGLQVLTQQLQDTQWRLVGHATPYETWPGVAALNIAEPGPVSLRVKPGGTGPSALTLTRLLASDYSAPYWLTFIGLPYRDMAFADETWWAVPDGEALLLRRTNRVRGHEDGLAAGEPISRDLLLRPLSPADFGETGDSGTAAQEPNSFHLLLLFERVQDISTPAVGLPLGRLIGVYKPVRAAIGSHGAGAAPDDYPPLRFVSFMPKGARIDLPRPVDGVAYIYRFHRPNGPGLPPLDDWAALLAAMFPTKDPGTGAGPEATVRWTPEMIGPIALAERGKWPADVTVPQALSTQTGARRIVIESALPVAPHHHRARVQILLDPQLGWRIERREHADELAPDDVVSGNCLLDDTPNGGGTLELHVAGGRPLARLAGWPGNGPPPTTPAGATWFDRAGKAFAAPCAWQVMP